MHPLTMFLKIAAEAARASTPQGSMANQIAGAMKQSIALLDGLTADTPVKQAHALASLLAESAYADANSQKERLGLTVGNAFLLVLEGAHHAQAPAQPAYGGASQTTAPWVQAYRAQSAQFSQEFQRLTRERQEMQRRREAEALAEQRRLQQQLEEQQARSVEQDRIIAELRSRLGIL